MIVVRDAFHCLLPRKSCLSHFRLNAWTVHVTDINCVGKLHVCMLIAAALFVIYTRANCWLISTGSTATDYWTNERVKHSQLWRLSAVRQSLCSAPATIWPSWAYSITVTKKSDLAKSGSGWILGVGCPNPVSSRKSISVHPYKEVKVQRRCYQTTGYTNEWTLLICSASTQHVEMLDLKHTKLFFIRVYCLIFIAFVLV